MKEARLKKGLSQSQLAKKCNVPLSTIQKFEGGFVNINNAKLETLLKICLTLDCKLEDILTDPNLKELLHNYKRLGNA